MGASDVLVLSSLSEGIPVVVIEAMAAGLPVVATAVGGVPEVVRHEREALLVPSQDEEAMATSLRRLRDDPPLRRALGEAARQRALELFSLDTMAERYARIYEQMLAAP
jgi:glycosyltransferase involved in cell wall biosynthesis